MPTTQPPRAAIDFGFSDGSDFRALRGDFLRHGAASKVAGKGQHQVSKMKGVFILLT